MANAYLQDILNKRNIYDMALSDYISELKTHHTRNEQNSEIFMTVSGVEPLYAYMESEVLLNERLDDYTSISGIIIKKIDRDNGILLTEQEAVDLLSWLNNPSSIFYSGNECSFNLFRFDESGNLVDSGGNLTINIMANKKIRRQRISMQAFTLTVDEANALKTYLTNKGFGIQPNSILENMVTLREAAQKAKNDFKTALATLEETHPDGNLTLKITTKGLLIMNEQDNFPSLNENQINDLVGWLQTPSFRLRSGNVVFSFRDDLAENEYLITEAQAVNNQYIIKNAILNQAQAIWVQDWLTARDFPTN